MAIVVDEIIGSGEGTSESQDLLYRADGSMDDAEIRSAVLGVAPSTRNGLIRGMPQARFVDGSIDSWNVTVPYQVRAIRSVTPTGGRTFSFDTRGGTIHITQGSVVATAAEAGKSAPNYGGAIGVTSNGVEGVDIESRAFSFPVTRIVSIADLSVEYIGTLYDLTGSVNNAAWTIAVIDGLNLSWQAGEVKFIGATGAARSDSEFELTYSFAASPNKTGLVIGDLTPIDKNGWQYLDVLYADDVDATAKRLVKKPIAAFVHDLLPQKDFASLGLSPAEPE